MTADEIIASPELTPPLPRAAIYPQTWVADNAGRPTGHMHLLPSEGRRVRAIGTKVDCDHEIWLCARGRAPGPLSMAAQDEARPRSLCSPR